MRYVEKVKRRNTQQASEQDSVFKRTFPHTYDDKVLLLISRRYNNIS